MNDSATQRGLRGDVSIDTLVVLLHGEPCRRFYRKMKRLCGKTPSWEPSRMGHGIYRLTLQQPSDDAMVHLAEHYPETRVQLLHIACDFKAASDREARELVGWLAQRFVQNWRRDDWVAHLGVGVYHRRPEWPQTGTVIYSRRHKQTGEPVARVELRIDGCAKCKPIARIAAELLECDPRAVLVKRMCFAEPNPRAIGRQVLDRTKAKAPIPSSFPYDFEMRAGGLVIRNARYEAHLDEWSTHSLLTYCKSQTWFQRRTALIPCALTLVWRVGLFLHTSPDTPATRAPVCSYAVDKTKETTRRIHHSHARSKRHVLHAPTPCCSHTTESEAVDPSAARSTRHRLRAQIP